VINWAGWGETAYDPTLTRVIYLGNETPQGIPYILWDMQKHSALATLYTTSFPIPRWSPDGTHFAVASSLLGNQTGFELYLMDRDGRQITPLTNFSAFYGGLDEIGDLSWSPDGRYIAFWLSIASAKQTPEHLAILDTTTDQVTDYCVPGTSETSRASDSHDVSIVWSPNSQQLAVRYQPDYQTSRTTLVDISRSYAFQISDNLEPVGWLASP
jgi:Tol biopolymer transport system component